MPQSENALRFYCQLLSIFTSVEKSVGLLKIITQALISSFVLTEALNLKRILRRIAKAQRHTLGETTNSIKGIRVDGPVSPSTVQREPNKLNTPSGIPSKKTFWKQSAARTTPCMS